MGEGGYKSVGFFFLGKESFKMKNWEGVLEKVVARLSKWLLPQLSYRGRVLVVNNLAASTLCYKVIVLEQEHWTWAAVLYLPVYKGGQGLVDVKS